MKLLGFVVPISIAMSLGVTNYSYANQGSLWEAWKELSDSWMTDEFEFRCYTFEAELPYEHFRLSKKVTSVTLQGLDSSMSWEDLNVRATTDAGLIFSSNIKLSDETIVSLVRSSPRISAYENDDKQTFESKKKATQKKKLEEAKRRLDACEKAPLSETEKQSMLNPNDKYELKRIMDFRCVSERLDVSSAEHEANDHLNLYSLNKYYDPTWKIVVDPRVLNAEVQINFKDGSLTARSLKGFLFAATPQNNPSIRIEDKVTNLPVVAGSCRID